MQLQYKNSTLEALHEIEFPTCENRNKNNSGCSFELFSQILRPFIIEDLEAECALKSVIEEYTGLTTLGTVSLDFSKYGLRELNY